MFKMRRVTETSKAVLMDVYYKTYLWYRKKSRSPSVHAGDKFVEYHFFAELIFSLICFLFIWLL